MSQLTENGRAVGVAYTLDGTDESGVIRADAVVNFDVQQGAVTRIRMVPTPGVDFSFDFQDLDLRPKGSGRR